MLISRNPNVCAAELDGDICLFEPTKSEYLNLNTTGSTIWNLLEQPTEFDELLRELQNKYSVDPEICRQETQAFVSEAIQRGMLHKQPLA